MLFTFASVLAQMKVYTFLLVIIASFFFHTESTNISLANNYNTVLANTHTINYSANNGILSYIKTTESNFYEVFGEIIEQEEKLINIALPLPQIFAHADFNKLSLSKFLIDNFYTFKNNTGISAGTPIFIVLQDFRL